PDVEEKHGRGVYILAFDLATQLLQPYHTRACCYLSYLFRKNKHHEKFSFLAVRGRHPDGL
ncbi:MAG: hypothetical protein AAF466_12635, partial [Bacteroidota bacterium]